MSYDNVSPYNVLALLYTQADLRTTPRRDFEQKGTPRFGRLAEIQSAKGKSNHLGGVAQNGYNRKLGKARKKKLDYEFN